MKGNIAGLMQQAQKMQQEMQKTQEELANMVVTGEAAGGLVKVTMTGKHAVRRVEIDPPCSMTGRCWKTSSPQPSTMRSIASPRRPRSAWPT